MSYSRPLIIAASVERKSIGIKMTLFVSYISISHVRTIINLKSLERFNAD